jgi:hypothetical protein
MPTIGRLPVGKTRIELGEEDPFISLEETPVVLADVRTALPRLRKTLMTRWPSINAVEIENRRITRRRNPHDPTQVFRDAVFGIAIYLWSRPARIFLDEVAREAGKKVGPEVGRQAVAAMKYVERWVKRMSDRAGSNRKSRPKTLPTSKQEKKKRILTG